MNTRKVQIIFIIIISGIFLLFYLFLLRGNKTFVLLDISIDKQGVQNVRLVEQRQPLGTKAGLLGREYTTLELDWQEDVAEKGKYLFLPGYVDLSDVYVRISGKQKVEEALTFDRVSVQWDTLYPLGILDEGTHQISVGVVNEAFQIMKGSDIASLWVETEKGMTYIHENRENTTSGTIRIVSANGQTEYWGEMERLKGRGNSSWHMAKKSYGIKLASGASLLGMPYGRSWVLCGGGDTTGLRNQILYTMAKECGLENAVDSEFVDLYIDGSYYGCYLLAEKIEIGFGRLDIGDLEETTEAMNEEPLENYPYYIFEENGKLWTGYSYPTQPANRTGGYLLEMEEYKQRFDAEPIRFTTDNEHKVVVKEPAMASLAQVEYIASFVQEFEDALYAGDGYNAQGKSYLEYIDLESFVKRYLVDEIGKSLDAGYSSYFFYKPYNEDRLYAGPVWDYDTSLGNNLTWGDPAVLRNPEGMYANADNWTRELWEKKEFREETKRIFQKEFLPYLKVLNEREVEDLIQRMEASMAMEQKYLDRTDWKEATNLLVDFLQKRTDYLEEEWR